MEACLLPAIAYFCAMMPSGARLFLLLIYKNVFWNCFRLEGETKQLIFKLFVLETEDGFALSILDNIA